MRKIMAMAAKQIEENELADTQYDEKGRIRRLGTSARDRAAITKDTVETVRILADIYHKACEHDATIEKLIAGVFGGGGNAAPTIHVHYPAPAVPSTPVPETTLQTAVTDAQLSPSSQDSAEPAPGAGTPGNPT